METMVQKMKIIGYEAQNSDVGAMAAFEMDKLKHGGYGIFKDLPLKDGDTVVDIGANLGLSWTLSGPKKN